MSYTAEELITKIMEEKGEIRDVFLAVPTFWLLIKGRRRWIADFSLPSAKLNASLKG